jgi:hypothetical protein
LSQIPYKLSNKGSPRQSRKKTTGIDRFPNKVIDHSYSTAFNKSSGASAAVMYPQTTGTDRFPNKVIDHSYSTAFNKSSGASATVMYPHLHVSNTCMLYRPIPYKNFAFISYHIYII